MDCTWPFAPLQLRAVRALPRDGYGWTEFIDHAGCEDREGCGRFFRRGADAVAAAAERVAAWAVVVVRAVGEREVNFSFSWLPGGGCAHGSPILPESEQNTQWY